MKKLGKITKPHGLKGDLKVIFWGELLPDVYEYFFLLPQSSSKTDNPQKFNIEKIKYLSKGIPIIKFEGINDRNQAETFRNHELYLPEEDLPEPDKDEIYIYQLEGLNLVTESGEELGIIEGFLENPAPYPILIVLSPAGVKKMYPLPPEYFHDHDPQKKLVIISDSAASFTDNKY